MKYLITGGVGSLGKALTKRLLKLGHFVTIYSRDEYKQHNMKAEFKNPKLEFIVGDIRDREKTIKSFRDVDYVVHAAALKHVYVGEEEPEEVIKTNILGSLNVIEACKVNGVKKAVLVATDKACHPTTLYGATKMIAEKCFIAANKNSKTTFVCVRYGNVVGSRGSVIEYLLKEKPESINITDHRMTRFWLSLDQAVDLVLLALKKAKKGEIFIPMAPASKISDMFKWLQPNIKIKETGMIAGEKLHESMMSIDETRHAIYEGKVFIILPEIFGVKYTESDFEYSSEFADKISKEDFLKLI